VSHLRLLGRLRHVAEGEVLLRRPQLEGQLRAARPQVVLRLLLRGPPVPQRGVRVALRLAGVRRISQLAGGRRGG